MSVEFSHFFAKVSGLIVLGQVIFPLRNDFTLLLNEHKDYIYFSAVPHWPWKSWFFAISLQQQETLIVLKNSNH